MQNDFISGALGTAEARDIVPRVEQLVREFDGQLIFTRDTHSVDYLNTREGKYLPVEHCIEGTCGWQICDELRPFVGRVIDKVTFGSTELADVILSYGEKIEKIKLCGLCTDICVISNAMILKAAFPETDIEIISDCCAGVTPKSHQCALESMRMVQIGII